MPQQTYIPITIRASGPKLFAFINAALAKAYDAGYTDGKRGSKKSAPEISIATLRKIHDQGNQPPG